MALNLAPRIFKSARAGSPVQAVKICIYTSRPKEKQLKRLDDLPLPYVALTLHTQPLCVEKNHLSWRRSELSFKGYNVVPLMLYACAYYLSDMCHACPGMGHMQQAYNFIALI